MMAEKRIRQWLTMREVCRILEIESTAFYKNVANRLTTRTLPGMKPRYSREDVERLAGENIKSPSQP